MIKLQETHSKSNPITKIPIEMKINAVNVKKIICYVDYKKKQEIKDIKRKATYIFMLLNRIKHRTHISIMYKS